MRWNDKEYLDSPEKISRNRRCCIISSVEEMYKKDLFPADLRACTNKQVRAELIEVMFLLNGR